MRNRSYIYKKAINKIAAGIPTDGGSILITGASGLIGSCLVDVLLEANYSYGKRFNIYAMARNADKLTRKFNGIEDVHCVVQNVTEPFLVKGIDYIIHAASNADPRSYALYPVETILANILGAKNVLEYSKNNCCRALFTSTFEVYGKLEQDVYSENDFGIIDMSLIRSCYPESKRSAEMLFKSYFEEYGVNCVTARLSSIYGPTMQENDSKAHAQFLRNALENKNIVLKSEGKQKRTYCYVMDAVSGLLTILFKGKSGEAYNVANENSISTIANLAQTIAKISGTKVVFDLPDAIESKGFSKPQNCVLNTEKLKALGWKGEYNLEEGLKETLSILHETESRDF